MALSIRLTKKGSKFLIAVGLTVILVIADNRIYPEVAFTPIVCVIGLLALALTLDPLRVIFAFLIFLVAVYATLTSATTFDASRMTDIIRLWLRVGAFTVTGVLAVIISIYKQKLNSQLSDYVELFQSIPLPIIVTDSRWVILEGNLQIANVLGVDASDMLNKSYEMFFHITCENDVEVDAFNSWLLNSGSGLFHAKLLIRKSDEEKKYGRATIYKLGWKGIFFR